MIPVKGSLNSQSAHDTRVEKWHASGIWEGRQEYTDTDNMEAPGHFFKTLPYFISLSVYVTILFIINMCASLSYERV